MTSNTIMNTEKEKGKKKRQTNIIIQEVSRGGTKRVRSNHCTLWRQGGRKAQFTGELLRVEEG